MRPLTWACFLVAGTCPLFADDRPQEDLHRLQGVWIGSSPVLGPGGKQPDVPRTMTITGNAFTIRFGSPKGQGSEVKGEIKLDERAQPKRWDYVKMTNNLGRALPNNLAIYDLEGDTLRICSAGPGGQRPTEFKDAAAGPPNLVVFRRVKNAPK